MINVNFDELKFKLLTKKEMVLHLDRLTRFKHPKIKYKRVFNEIILKNLIEPKFNLKTVETINTDDYIKIVETIWNASSENQKPDLELNELLIKNAQKTFYLDEESEKLLNAKINIQNPLKNFNEKKIPKNIQQLLIEKTDYKNPKIVLEEGITEDTLLPKFANIARYDFDKFGVEHIPAGGKNQVSKMYLELVEITKLPIFILLDLDATETANVLRKRLRKTDRIYVIQKGEFEDILPKNLILKTLNTFYRNTNPVDATDLSIGDSATKSLEELFKKKGFGEFKKAVFAKQVKEVVSTEDDLSDEIRNIIAEIMMT